MPPATALDRMRAALGPGGFLDDPALIEPFVVDHRRLYHGACRFVARPADPEQVAAIVRICAEYGIGIVPQGGNTGYCGGATPDESGSQIIICLQRMNRIRSADPDGYALQVDAGCTLLQTRQAADTIDRLFPLSLGSEGTCQIGGNLSTNAGGTAVLYYGVMRDLVLGLEVVLPDGRILDQLHSLRKDNTGYDLKQWFIGAEGTLGIITGATLKLFPKPAAHATALIAVADLKAAVTLLGALRTTLAGSLTTFEVMPRLALELAIKHIAGVSDPLGSAQPWYVLAEIGLAGTADVHDGQFADTLNGLRESGEILDAVLASSETQRLALWHIRENIPAAQTREGASIKHDISLPIAAIPEFVATAGAAVLAIAPGARMVSYGHLGDGNLHFNFSPAPGAEAAEFLAKTEAIKRAVHDLVAERRGSFSAEHGIGKLKVGELARYENPVALDMMRLIKHSLDPHGIMNPGKVLPPPS